MKTKHPEPQPGQVLILWRFRKDWRNGSNHDRHFKFYHTATASDAATFLKKKAPFDELFEYKLSAQRNGKAHEKEMQTVRQNKIRHTRAGADTSRGNSYRPETSRPEPGIPVGISVPMVQPLSHHAQELEPQLKIVEEKSGQSSSSSSTIPQDETSSTNQMPLPAMRPSVASEGETPAAVVPQVQTVRLEEKLA